MNEIRAICVFCASSQSVDESFKSVALELKTMAKLVGLDWVYRNADVWLLFIRFGLHFLDFGFFLQIS